MIHQTNIKFDMSDHKIEHLKIDSPTDWIGGWKKFEKTWNISGTDGLADDWMGGPLNEKLKFNENWNTIKDEREMNIIIKWKISLDLINFHEENVLLYRLTLFV